MTKIMDGVTEYEEGMEVKLVYQMDRHTKKEKYMILASNEAGHCCTRVDLNQLLDWVKTNKPELINRPCALAEPAIKESLTGAEPVAWMWDEADYRDTDLRGRGWHPVMGRQHPNNESMTRNVKALYTAPPQTEQKPVGKFAKFTDNIWREVTDGSPGVLLYTAPPQPKEKDNDGRC